MKKNPKLKKNIKNLPRWETEHKTKLQCLRGSGCILIGPFTLVSTNSPVTLLEDYVLCNCEKPTVKTFFP